MKNKENLSLHGKRQATDVKTKWKKTLKLPYKNVQARSSQVVQGLGICLAMQGTQVQSLGTKIPHTPEQLSPGTTTTEPKHHNQRAHEPPWKIPQAATKTQHSQINA